MDIKEKNRDDASVPLSTLIEGTIWRKPGGTYIFMITEQRFVAKQGIIMSVNLSGNVGHICEDKAERRVIILIQQNNLKLKTAKVSEIPQYLRASSSVDVSRSIDDDMRDSMEDEDAGT